MPEQQQQPTISFTKVILIAVLGGLCLFLQCTVWTLQVLLEERRSLKQQRKPKVKGTTVKSESESDGAEESHLNLKSVKSMDLSESSDFHLNRLLEEPAPNGHSTQAAAYWRLAVELWLSSWDPFVASSSAAQQQSSFSAWDADFVGNATVIQAAWAALEQAAEHGHSTAQFHYANALASGIFAGEAVQTSWQDSSIPQQQKAWLYWHMAAMAGNVEATLALAYRLESGTGTKSASGAATIDSSAASCSQQLPYFRQAALGILDALESNVQSRAKVLPAADKHILYQIHLHGGTPSKLEFHNKADESADALQFYHLRAFSNKKKDVEQAASAAYTLGNYYHYGVRGVPQNLTMAAHYYERAANLNHWEAAGQVGTFYLWGMGVQQNVYTAHKFFRLGMPLGITGCQRRYQARHKKSESSSEESTDLSLCDTESMHGMGILKLMGLPHVMQIDLAQAEELFTMARDQGSADAAYHHAMMKLGWATNWKHYPRNSNPHTANDGTTSAGATHRSLLPWEVSNNKFVNPHDHLVTLGEYQAVITDLTLAAGKGHIQARVRLGLLFADGVEAMAAGTNTVQTAVAKDCSKALKQFKWVTDSACPFRAQRLRHAYKQYMAGNTAASLLNYLTAAEAGSTVGLLNAAFLLEQGECLSSSLKTTTAGPSASATTTTTSPFLTPVECAKASARLWKAAAQKGHGEASLRVGDFYYYQRFREQHVGFGTDVGPFGWVRYILYPEKSLPLLVSYLAEKLQAAFMWLLDTEQQVPKEAPVCEATTGPDGDTQQCTINHGDKDNNGRATSSASSSSSVTSDLEMAAHYYQMATETADGARAHFNLGFLYEWGLGLKQDFPLAKRHYDLAVSSSTSKAAELPVAIALTAMTVHEKILKAHRAWWDYHDDDETTTATTTTTMLKLGRLEKLWETIWEHHVFNLETLALILLIGILIVLLRMRNLQQGLHPPPRR